MTATTNTSDLLSSSLGLSSKNRRKYRANAAPHLGVWMDYLNGKLVRTSLRFPT